MRTDRDGAAHQARGQRAFGTLHDLLSDHALRCVSTEGCDGTGERPGGIGHLVPRARLVEMLMRIDEPWGDQPPRQVDRPHTAWHGRRWGQRGNTPICANHKVKARRTRVSCLQDPTPT